MIGWDALGDLALVMNIVSQIDEESTDPMDAVLRAEWHEFMKGVGEIDERHRTVDKLEESSLLSKREAEELRESLCQEARVFAFSGQNRLVRLWQDHLRREERDVEEWFQEHRR